MVIKDDWAHVCQNVKDQCTFLAKGLIAKLVIRFLIQNLMNVMGIIYLSIGYNQKLLQCSLVTCKSWKNITTLPRSCNQMVFAILLCWMLLYLNDNHHFLLPLCNPIVALPYCPHMIVTLPLTCGGAWPITRFWSSRCLNFSNYLNLLLLWFWGVLKMKEHSLLSFSQNQSWKID